MNLAETDASEQRQQRASKGKWRRLPLIESRWLRIAMGLGLVAYLVLALSSVEVNWARVAEGASRGLDFLGAFTRRISLAAGMTFGPGCSKA